MTAGDVATRGGPRPGAGLRGVEVVGVGGLTEFPGGKVGVGGIRCQGQVSVQPPIDDAFLSDQLVDVGDR